MKTKYRIGDTVRIHFIDGQTLSGEVFNFTQDKINLKLTNDFENGLLKNMDFIFGFEEIYEVKKI